MDKITKEQVTHVAHLARLSVSEEEAERFTEQLDKIIEFAEQLNEVDTDHISPTSHVLDIHNVLREDKTAPSLDREEALRNAPDQENGQVKVPSVLE
ncbi:Asp-tRNA(Asn)/Glu-tRNA(Gln) amidotransferase subunit GatC [Sinobaca sp. H24]|uniref:Asp-tRNA(Asn)/Glu-tRNA(Gln) amidotransferase subunit GatC n=1 Tax=Sinobaca sp. H24 TaxID=2923376 RepID=UPI0020795D12|nr:Asp-tRNA(Asn)/Glu-tRNA(Gln) amidotransferase subunit GatC [Sinobaca sp. H24]